MKKIILFSIIICFVSAYAYLYSKTTSRLARYWKKLDGKTVQCLLCPRKCILVPGQRGVCTVRINKNGQLHTLGYGNPVAVHVDPIEKKPFFQVTPGEPAFSIAVAGCNMRCLFCQNWQISQSKPDETINHDLSPEQIIESAKKNNCRWIVFTYTEPTVFYEYMLDIAKLAKKHGLKNGIHSCGYINKEPLLELLPYIDAINIDLKGFTKDFYKKMGAYAELEPVLETLKTIKENNVWLEITNLIIPTANDNMDDIKKMCEWIKDNLGPNVPIHFSRFYPAFKLQNLPPTPIKTLEEAKKIAEKVGLNFIYIGNVPSHKAESTFCPKCGKLVIKRRGYVIIENKIKNKKCAFCGYKMPGIWDFD